jgi:hypothetical protein
VLPPQRLVSAHIAVCVFALVVACDVGSVPLEGSGSGGPDGGAGGGPDPTGGGGGGGGGDTPDGGAVDPTACDEPVATNASGQHNAGEACLNCHVGGDAPRFQVGGTIYSALGGGSPVVGATVRMIDANGTEHVAISARNGNFWLTEAVALPLTVQASSCPSTLNMVSQSSVGNCNAGGCHDADFRIHVP